jgi:hypothetical protein
MNESSNDDDSAAGSQSSQRSGVSLLDRIRLQREREARQQQLSNDQLPPATSIQVPQYNPNHPENMNNNSENTNSPYFSWESNGNSLGTGDFFSNAWSNIHSTMETGMASLQQMQHEDDLDSSLLLPPSSGDEANHRYSMANYFMTFVKDVNDGFHGLPLIVRIMIVAGMLYVAIKLL